MSIPVGQISVSNFSAHEHIYIYSQWEKGDVVRLCSDNKLCVELRYVICKKVE